MIKEALHNAVKYSGAKGMTIVFSHTEREFKIQLMEIGGLGFDFEHANETANGLYNMEKRMKGIGTLLFQRNNQGTTIEIKIVNE